MISQSIGDITNSILDNVNVSSQTELNNALIQVCRLLESKIDELNKDINVRIDSVNKKIDDEIKVLTDEINTQEKETVKRIDELKRQKPERHQYVKLLIIITVLSISFFALFAWLNKCFAFGLSDSSIVLAFVGIAATFVVVSNYIQVEKTKDEFSIKVKEFEDKFEKAERQYDDAIKKEFKRWYSSGYLDAANGLPHRIWEDRS
jgi:uncharacterized membrane protein (DUF485 family)